VNDDQRHFLALLGQPPARLTVEQAAWVLNCQTHDIPVLVAAKLLRPLGHPPPNGTKYFSTAEVVELTRDRAWLAKITSAVCLHWKTKNAHKSIGSATDQPNQAESFELLTSGDSH